MLDRHALSFKLWAAFIAFAVVIMGALWLLQIIFLQGFYENMKRDSVERVADEIIAHYATDDAETFRDTVDNITFRNAVLVIIADSSGIAFYSSDEHGSGTPDAGAEGATGATAPSEGGALPGGAGQGGTGQGGASQGGPTFGIGPWRQGGGGQAAPFSAWRRGGSRALPEDFREFLDKLNASPNGRLQYITPTTYAGSSFVYGAMLQDGGVLYITTPMAPLDITVQILRTQLVYVTILSVLLALVIAFFIARGFAKPIRSISREALRLAQNDYSVKFSRGFCSEIDGLAGTLDHVAEELSKTETLRRELMANISHDLRTPLTMVKAYAEMIRDISGGDPAKRGAHLEVILSESDRLSNLVNDILELSVLQSGNAPIARESVNLSELARRVIGQFALLGEARGFTMESTIKPDQYVLADERRVEQVLYNLIGNAVNYVDERGVIHVRVLNRGGALRVEVENSGEGIAEGDLPHIWDRYYRSGAAKRDVVGTGLGLSIVKGVLDAHGARYGVENLPGGGGCLFWFELQK